MLPISASVFETGSGPGRHRVCALAYGPWRLASHTRKAIGHDREGAEPFGATSGACDRLEEADVLLALGMVALGIATFVALIGFVELCDRM